MVELFRIADSKKAKIHIAVFGFSNHLLPDFRINIIML